jgi:hypothetical protein
MGVLRNLLSVIAGLIACNLVFAVLGLATMTLWPDYAVHGHRWLDQRVFTFTPIMACMNLLFWSLAFAAAGSATARIARNQWALWVTAGLILMQATYTHLLHEWSHFPWWYNIAVVTLVLPAAFVGGKVSSNRGS